MMAKDLEPRAVELGFDGRLADHKTVVPRPGRACAGFAITLQALAAPWLDVAIDTQRNDHSVAGDTVKFAQDGQPLLAVSNVIEQAHAENAVHRIRRQVDGESRCLQHLDA